MNEKTISQCHDTFAQIITTDLPQAKGVALRGEGRKEQAKVVRALLKELGIKGVSVTAPVYSMAQAIDISLPYSFNHGCTNGAGGRDCPFCKTRYKAQRHLEAIILAAYPDMGDRSDPMTDYFNYRLSFN